jgi:hypothetical protein
VAAQERRAREAAARKARAENDRERGLCRGGLTSRYTYIILPL